jgi:SAM-dependent methyltransferase
MRKDAIQVEESRLIGVESLDDYHVIKERHRVFPAIFEDRGHHNILDIAAGVGCASCRIYEGYSGHLVASDITPTCLKILHGLGVPTLSFDIDDPNASFPFADGQFDAVVSLVTLEHLIYFDHFLEEIYRILSDDGFLYISTPNYAAPEYLIQPVFTGKTFHDPLGSEERYEFYAHVRYFTYRTLVDLVKFFKFSPETVYLALPKGSTRYMGLRENSKLLAFLFHSIMWLKHNLLPARFASEPILCCKKSHNQNNTVIRKVVL